MFVYLKIKETSLISMLTIAIPLLSFNDSFGINFICDKFILLIGIDIYEKKKRNFEPPIGIAVN